MLEIATSKGRRPHIIMKRKFRFPANKEYKFKVDLYNIAPDEVTSEKLSEAVNKNKEWRVTRAQMRRIVDLVTPDCWFIRYNAQFNGQIDMVERNENAEFKRVERQDKEHIINWLGYQRMWVYFNEETREFEIWNLAIGGFTLKLDEGRFDKEWRGEPL